MKKREKIMKITLTKLLLFVFLLLGIFVNEACAGNISSKIPYLRKFIKVMNIIERDYANKDEIDKEKLIDGAIEGMIKSLDDPHSVYLSKEYMKELSTTSEGKYGGVGMIISEKDDYIVVVTPMEGCPAYKKGIKAGDFILSVDKESIKGMDVSEAANRLRGKPGTKVLVEMLRDDVTFSVEIKRAIIDLPSEKHAIIKNKYGYLRIIQFAGTTSKYVKEALEEFKKKRVKGIIVDLRYNPGGLLREVIEIVDFFQSEGVIVSTIGRSAFDNTTNKASEKTTIINKNVPVIVLIDQGSASASEIFAGAIKDTKRGILIGEKSFGKGSVQTIYNLGDDGIKLTIAKYYTPSGICINGVGIDPDIEVKEPELTDGEKEALQKIYKDKAIDKLIKQNSDPTKKEIEEFITILQNKGYKLSERFLRKLIKNAAEFDDDKKTVYDLEFDLQLIKAVEILDKDLITQKDDEFYLNKSK